MASSTDLLRLKLAARTLLEWRTPNASDEYVRVLDALLVEHSVARARGMSSARGVARLDHDGHILTYLCTCVGATGQFIVSRRLSDSGAMPRVERGALTMAFAAEVEARLKSWNCRTRICEI